MSRAVIDPERRRRVEDVCDAALVRDVRECATFVAAACADDETLRWEVEALLAHAQTAERFLETAIGEVAACLVADDHRASLAGRQIGSYLWTVAKSSSIGHEMSRILCCSTCLVDERSRASVAMGPCSFLP